MKLLTPLVLPPLSAVYGAITKARLALYERGALHVSRLDGSVISIGNITTGGTGKTPLVEWFARALASEGRRVCILTRGYGRPNPTQRIVVSDEQNVLSTPEQAGDEAFLLAKNLRGLATVISDPNRLASGQWAKKNFDADTFLLDDGFQHLRLYRDLNVVTVDATNPWGGGRLLPFGRLREPLSGLARADCIVLTRAEQVEAPDRIVSALTKFSRGRPVFVSKMQVRSISLLDHQSSTRREEAFQGPVAAFCGVGNPQSFFKQLRSEGYQLAITRAFADHHPYRITELQSLIEEAKRLGVRSLVTTEKDAVKISSFELEIPCYSLKIEIVVEEGRRLMELVREKISKRSTHAG